MRLGEVTVPSRAAFDGMRHLKRIDCIVSKDLDHRPYARLRLPSAKTAKPGETQDVFLTQQGQLCPIWALLNLSLMTPASLSDPLFSWRDTAGVLHPLTRKSTLSRINNIFQARGWGTTFGHSFRIGGASFYLAQRINPEVVRLAGRWKSLAYETYIRAFEQVASRHLAHLEQQQTSLLRIARAILVYNGIVDLKPLEILKTHEGVHTGWRTRGGGDNSDNGSTDWRDVGSETIFIPGFPRM